MKRVIPTLLIVFLFLNGSSQKTELIPFVTELISAGNFNAASVYLDSVLKKHPRSVDVLMMKGNIILNRDYISLPDYFSVENAELVTDTAFPKMRTGIKIIPAATVLPVEKLWKQCLTIDSTRVDIYQGLCALYAMALMKTKLKAEILQLIKVETKKDSGQVYRIADYARKFKERGRFDDAMEVYQFIARQYPSLAGIQCDMGWEYFYEGRMTDAVKYFNAALKLKNIDETTYLNCAFAFSELGYFDDAQSAFEAYSKTYHAQMDVFYRALVLFAIREPGYQEVFKIFISSTDSNAYFDEYQLAKALIALGDEFTFTDFERLTNGNYREWYLSPIYERALKEFIGVCIPALQYGAFQCSIKNYKKAVELLQAADTCAFPSSEKDRLRLYHAYALYRQGEKEKAGVYFKSLFNSDSPFNQQAAKYFYIKLLLRQQNNKEANALLTGLMECKPATKYSVLAKRLKAATKD